MFPFKNKYSAYFWWFLSLPLPHFGVTGSHFTSPNSPYFIPISERGGRRGWLVTLDVIIYFLILIFLFICCCFLFANWLILLKKNFENSFQTIETIFYCPLIIKEAKRGRKKPLLTADTLAPLLEALIATAYHWDILVCPAGKDIHFLWNAAAAPPSGAQALNAKITNRYNRKNTMKSFWYPKKSR